MTGLAENDIAALTTNFTSSTPENVGVASTTHSVPKTSDAHVEACPESYNGYCHNDGICSFLPGINRPSCQCVNDFEGERCMFKILHDQKQLPFGDYGEVFIIGTIFGLVLLATMIGAIIYIVRKRKQVQSVRRRYERAAEGFIDSNYPLSGVEEEDQNQNVSSTSYVPLPVDVTQLEHTDETLETVPPTYSSVIRLKDPPFRKTSSNSAHSAHSAQSAQSSSKESTV